MLGVAVEYGRGEVLADGRHLLDYSAKMMSATLAEIPEGVYRAEDFLDHDGIPDQPQRIALAIRIRRRRAGVQSTRRAPQCPGTATPLAATTHSPAIYRIRHLPPHPCPP